MAEEKITLGKAIDQIINALEALDESSRAPAIQAACTHLKIPVASSPVTPTAASPLQPGLGQTPGSAGMVLPSPNTAGRKVDVRLLKDKKQPASAKQMACIVAFYLQELAPQGEAKTTISSQDIEKYFKQANFKLPKKVEQVLVDAKRSGYFESTVRGEYKLNAVGYNLVAHGLPASKPAK